jgi:hypothetical protein
MLYTFITIYSVGDMIGLKISLQDAKAIEDSIKDSKGVVKSTKATVKCGYNRSNPTSQQKCITIQDARATVKCGCDGGKKGPISSQSGSSFQRYGIKRYQIKNLKSSIKISDYLERFFIKILSTNYIHH